jgi:dTDP-4-dehydrorhamnose reductase
MDCDIADKDAVIEQIDLLQPRVIINCAAWTNVDGAEEEENEEAVMRSNLRGAGVLRQEFDGFLIHLSTGFVFDGKAGPYSEEDVPAPLSVYAWSKLGGEVAARMKEPTLVIRTLDLYGPNTPTDFVRQIRDMLELQTPYELPTTLFGSPTYIPHLVEGVLGAESLGLAGILNVVGDTTMSRHKWGQMIAESFGYDPELIVPSDEIKGSAPRPLRGGLLVDKAKSLGVPIFSPQDGLNDLAEWRDE